MNSLASGRRARKLLAISSPSASLLAQALVRHRAQHAVGAELQKARDTRLLQEAHTVMETHRPAHVAGPVLGRGGLVRR